INYYFGDKAGLLKAIIEEFSERYYQGIKLSNPVSDKVWDGVLSNISAIVEVYRSDIELAIAAERVLWMDIPEVHAAQIHQHKAHRADLDQWFRSVGLDIGDRPVMAIARGLVTSLVSAHFNARYHYEFVLSPATRKQLVDAQPAGYGAGYDDAFYEEYCRHLAEMYLSAMEALAGHRKAVSGERPCELRKTARSGNKEKT
ncbi:MAG: hypothetical protein JSU73_02340, partial [candidate division WOR-3 bacterium]